MKYLSITLMLVLGLIVSANLGAASLSAYRVYLDTEQRVSKFLVRNKSNVSEDCTVAFDYHAYQNAGTAKSLTKEEKKVFIDQALRNIRYSPRQFTIAPRSHQFIAFTYRPQLIPIANEQRVYMHLRCVKEETKGLSILNPTLVQSIPIIIRNDRQSELFTDIGFSNITWNNGTLKFDLTISGTRSSFGDLIKVNLKTGEEKTLNKNIGLYPEMNYRPFTYSIAPEELNHTQILFKENTNFGGEKILAIKLSEAI